MNILLRIIVMALMGGLIGWITNLLAVKMIFRPSYPIVIPVLGITVQGVIPKRRKEIAHSIGNIVEKELISINDIISKVAGPEVYENIRNKIVEQIKIVLEDKLPSLIMSAFRGVIFSYIEEFFEKEGKTIISNFINNTIQDATSNLDLSKMVEDKINAFDIAKLEEVILEIAHRELKYIEILGGILGFLIGIFQGIFAVII